MSNKTPKKPVDETESAHSSDSLIRVRSNRRDFKHILFGLVMLFFGGWAVWSGVQSLTDTNTRLFAPKGILSVELVNTPEARRQGLSGRESLAANKGMLFEFDQSSDQHCFWMKDMNFAIDMIWLDEAKKVVHIEKNVGPDTYPDTFCPDTATRYVLEVPAFRSDAYGIAEGEELRF